MGIIGEILGKSAVKVKRHTLSEHLYAEETKFEEWGLLEEDREYVRNVLESYSDVRVEIKKFFNVDPTQERSLISLERLLLGPRFDHTPYETLDIQNFETKGEEVLEGIEEVFETEYGDKFEGIGFRYRDYGDSKRMEMSGSWATSGYEVSIEEI